INTTAVNQSTVAYTPASEGADAGNYTAAVTLPDGTPIQVGSQGVIGADGVTGLIITDPTNGFDLVVNAPNATADQTFNVSVTLTDGSTVTGTVSNGTPFVFTDPDPTATPDQVTATVDL